MKLNIALLPGDGIGPEVISQAVKCVDAVCRKFGHEVSYHFAYVGACAIDRFGDAFPEVTYKTCLDSDAVLFGAVGDPKYDNDPTAKEVVQFNAKCCCEDFDSKIQFTDNFVFSTDKHQIVNLQSFILPHLDLSDLHDRINVVINNHSQRKTLKFLSGQERIVFFSSLKLNPLVF